MPISRRTALQGLLAASLATTTRPAGAAELRTDADILEAAFRALHPGLSRYNSAADLDGHFAKLRAAMARSASPADTWLGLTRFTAAIRCGHTFVNATNQKDAGEAFVSGGRNRMPFGYRWLAGRMIVGHAGGVAGISAGDEILALGDTPVGPLATGLRALAAADGANDAKRTRLADLDDTEAWPLPDVALPILAPRAFAESTLRLTVRTGDGRPRTQDAPLLTRAERVAARDSRRPPAADGAAWTVTTLPDRTRLITMPTWALYESAWDWKAWLDQQVDMAIDSRAPAIILDLRGNGGGQDCGNHLLSRMLTRDVVLPDALRYVRYRRTPPDLDRYLSTWDKSFRDWGQDADGPDARGFYRMTRWDADARGDVVRPRGRRYAGKLIAITDATNSSATFQFAQTLKANGLGTLVGAPTGGNRRGINGGAFFFLRLPASGFEVDLPLVATFPRTPQPDAGIAPDVPVATTAADLTRGRDPQRAAAVRLARG
ncbi:MAG: peptidase S41 [Alphaproteobacteria bacterium]|nr:peptidase S41 [Alphaproteobacteria bacterium]MBU1515551.1 peptidase S41 [Alphaproteobacteria bacterium]MBU2095549.1 peptidase S41 [Alphaproteobacteria bacterium]MBU2150790.1 peptidase S41 [Alphaproteobacteria bacterium]MBU2307055.1 peptidase S41 [Alphaproteobacteria bacterium]